MYELRTGGIQVISNVKGLWLDVWFEFTGGLISETPVLVTEIKSGD